MYTKVASVVNCVANGGLCGKTGTKVPLSAKIVFDALARSEGTIRADGSAELRIL